MSAKPKRLRWQTIRRIPGVIPHTVVLYHGDDEIVHVVESAEGWHWFTVGRTRRWMPSRSSSRDSAIYATESAAKMAALAYVHEHLARAGNAKGVAS